jgi:hypothetical protein
MHRNRSATPAGWSPASIPLQEDLIELGIARRAGPVVQLAGVLRDDGITLQAPVRGGSGGAKRQGHVSGTDVVCVEIELLAVGLVEGDGAIDGEPSRGALRAKHGFSACNAYSR